MKGRNMSQETERVVVMNAALPVEAIEPLQVTAKEPLPVGGKVEVVNSVRVAARVQRWDYRLIEGSMHGRGSEA